MTTSTARSPASPPSPDSCLSLSPATKAILTPRLPSKYVPHTPTAKQALFLCLSAFGVDEALYGGAAGGGKSDVLLMAGLQYVDVPGHASIIFRKTYKQLTAASALMSRSHEWLGGTDAHWRGDEKTWYFPTTDPRRPATLAFGHLEHEDDVHNYDSAEYQDALFDELTQLSLWQYRYVAFSRVRRLEGSEVPLRRLSASNPIGRGYAWVKARFVDGKAKARAYVPARIEDNPYLDREAYVAGLQHLDPVTKAALLAGDWSARAGGGRFRSEWFGDAVLSAPVGPDVVRVRRWDLAATAMEAGVAQATGQAEPDWTVGLLLSRGADQVYYVEDVVREQLSPRGVEQLVRATSRADGMDTLVRMEQEPGASGKSLIDYYRRTVVPDRDFGGVPSTGSKQVRAAPVSGQVQAGNVKIVAGPWNETFLEELDAFPGDFDDQVDAFSGAYLDLAAIPYAEQPILSDRDLELIEGRE
jgi:predicted phage terminase large subunit-like protein